MKNSWPMSNMIIIKIWCKPYEWSKQELLIDCCIFPYNLRIFLNVFLMIIVLISSWPSFIKPNPPTSKPTTIWLKGWIVSRKLRTPCAIKLWNNFNCHLISPVEIVYYFSVLLHFEWVSSSLIHCVQEWSFSFNITSPQKFIQYKNYIMWLYFRNISIRIFFY